MLEKKNIIYLLKSRNTHLHTQKGNRDSSLSFIHSSLSYHLLRSCVVLVFGPQSWTMFCFSLSLLQEVSELNSNIERNAHVTKQMTIFAQERENPLLVWLHSSPVVKSFTQFFGTWKIFFPFSSCTRPTRRTEEFSLALFPIFPWPKILNCQIWGNVL